jgi:hypothetical protein
MCASISGTTAGTCQCCGTPTPATLKCRTRGGTASLCGFSEYASASSPPKKYRTQTMSGAVVGCNYTGGCAAAGFKGGFGLKWSGSYDYSSSTCAALSNTQYEDFYGTDNVSYCGVNYGSPLGHTLIPAGITPYPSYFGDGGGTLVQAATYQTWPYLGVCSYANQKFTGSVTATLSNEDLETDAITRLLAGGGGTWGSWIVSGAAGCTGTPPSCCRAQYEQRTSAFSFAYNESQFRVQLGGLTPSTFYYCRIEIYRRVRGGGGLFTHYSTMVLSGTTDGSGNYSVDGNAPNDEGYETYAQSAAVII